MSYSFSNGTHAQRAQSARSAQQVVAPLTHPSLKPHYLRPDRRTINQLLDQIEHALQHFSSAALALAPGQAACPSMQLQPSARRAEAAMHRLQDLSDLRSAVTVSLSQSLTVLVLLADLLAGGTASDADVQGIHDLLARNVQQAHTCIAQLRSGSQRAE